MQSLWSWFFPRRAYRCFARLDGNGRCQAFKQCSQPPVGAGWVEINEIRLQWLGQFLPASAHLTRRPEHSRMQRALTA